MIKRISAMLLLLALLTSCGGTPAQTTPPPSSTQSVAVPAPEPTPSPTAAPVPEADPAPSVTSQSATPVEKTWWQIGLAKENFIDEGEGCGGGTSYSYVYDDTKKLSYNCIFSKDGQTHEPTLITASMKQTNDIGTRILPDRFFELVAFDDTKYTGDFYEKGILLTRSLPGGDKDTDNAIKLLLDATDYQMMLQNMDNVMNTPDRWAAPAWMTMLRRSRFTSATVNVDGQPKNIVTALSSDLTSWMLEDFTPHVNPDSAKVVHQTTLPDAVSTVELQFNNDLVYTIYYGNTQVLVTASGMDTACLYDYRTHIRDDKITVHSPLNLLEAYARGQINPRTGKPVIYLYPEKQTDVSVKLDFGGEMLYTYPTIKDKGWNVTAYPDGRLINKADQTEHYYLFWEGNSDTEWKFDEGFCVAGGDMEAFLRQKLAYMGLTPREYNDFITYWVPKLKDNKYNLITFSGEQYEQLAPLTVSPTPDSVLRVHMVYKPLTERQTIPEQVLTTFERKGFSVVEWGGSVAK